MATAFHALRLKYLTPEQKVAWKLVPCTNGEEHSLVYNVRKTSYNFQDSLYYTSVFCLNCNKKKWYAIPEESDQLEGCS